MLKGLIVTALAGAALIGVGSGCESQAANGALIGGAAGAGVGAIIGHNSDRRTAEGTLIGGAVGAIGGGLIGNEQDKANARARDRYYEEDRSARRYGGDDRGYYSERRYIEDEYGNRTESYYEERHAKGY